jgi:hypothetical protein
MLRTPKRHGLPPQPKLWFSNLAASFGEDLKIRIASLDNRPLAAILTLRDRRTLVYKYGCSDESEHNRGGMQMLMWRAIQEAKQEGLATLDLGRSDAEPRLFGVRPLGAAHFDIFAEGQGAQPAQVTGGSWKLRVAGISRSYR